MRALYEERLQQQQSTASREVSRAAPPHLCTTPHTTQTRAQNASRSSRTSHPAGPSLPVAVPACVSQLAQSAQLCRLCVLQCPPAFPCPLEMALPSRMTLAVYHHLKTTCVLADGLQRTFQPCSCVRRTLRTWWQPRQCSRSGRQPSARRARPRRPRNPSSSEPECSMVLLVPGPSLASSYICIFSVLDLELHAGKLPVQQHVEAQIFQRCR